VIDPSQRLLPDNTKHSQETFMPSAGFEPAVPVKERPQTHTSDHADTGIGLSYANVKMQNRGMSHETASPNSAHDY